jgi:folate-binding protein YgfZ
MNPKGRVLADLLIAKEDEDSYTLEFDKAIYEKMKQHVKRYKIRAKVDLIDQNETSVFVLLDAFQQIPSEKEALQIIGNDKLKIYKDPRLATMGYRIYVSKTSSPEFSDACKQVDTIEYDKIRIMNGVAEGSTDVEYESSFPLEINYEYLHGINLHKGCYLGQELTARTYYRGEQRRRLLPIFVEPKIQLIPGQEIFLKEGDVIREKSIGKIRSSVENIALAKLRIHEALEKPETSMLVMEGETKVIPIQPYWMLLSRN